MQTGTQFELRAEVCAEMAEALEVYFYECGLSPWGIVQKERTDPYAVFGFFPDTAAADRALGELRAAFPELPEDFELQEVIDADWQNAYKKFVKPWSDRQLHWIPLWDRQDCTPPEGSAIVYLDAGMAFGTGCHETTRLCARRLIDFYEARFIAGTPLKIVDAGCGSGVLAFSAVALGFEDVRGFDYDADVLSVCEGNAQENPHLAKIPFSVGTLETGLIQKECDLLLANIQTNVLIPDSDYLIKALKDGGTLALSGILVSEIKAVQEHFHARCVALRGAGFTMDSRKDGEWADLCLQLEN